MKIPCSHTKHTHIYKTHGNTPITLDIYHPHVITSNANKNENPKPRPILLYFHGGYLITGTRVAIPSWLLNSVLSLGCTVISPDFRVLPGSNGFAVIDDVLAACHWIVANPSECSQAAYQGNTQHTPEIMFAGASAGGWCALVSALHFCAQQLCGHGQISAAIRPKALLLLYPMLCLSSPRWCRPVFAAPEPMCETTVRDKLASADQQIKDGEISLGEAFPTSEEEMRTRERLPLLWAIMQSGRWLDYLTGAEGFATDLARSGIEATIEKWNVNQPQGNNMEQLFPLDFADFTNQLTTVPTIIIHGTQDLEVPISESETLLKRIEDAQVDGTNTGGVKLYRVEGAGHVFDLEVDPRDVEIDDSSMEETRGTGKGYTSVLAEALRELRRVTE